MPKPRYKRRQSQQKASSKLSQPQRHVENKTKPPRKFLGLPVKMTIEILGIVASILAIGGFVYDVYRGPEMHVQTAQVSNPFLLRFSLWNPSFIFSMDGMEINCLLKRVNFERNNVIENVGLEGFARQASIPRRQTIQYICPLDQVITGMGQVITARLLIMVKFKTLGIQRESQSETFNWDNVSRQWIEGEIVN